MEEKKKRQRNKNKNKNRRLIYARMDLDYTQDDLAEIVGVSRQTIFVLESGNCNVSLDICRRVCKALNSDLNTMFWEQWKEGEEA